MFLVLSASSVFFSPTKNITKFSIFPSMSFVSEVYLLRLLVFLCSPVSLGLIRRIRHVFLFSYYNFVIENIPSFVVGIKFYRWDVKTFSPVLCQWALKFLCLLYIFLLSRCFACIACDFLCIPCLPRKIVDKKILILFHLEILVVLWFSCSVIVLSTQQYLHMISQKGLFLNVYLFTSFKNNFFTSF